MQRQVEDMLAAAVLAANERDFDSAYRRATENLLVGRYLARFDDVMVHVRGVFIIENALDVREKVARQAGDTPVEIWSGHLRERVHRYRNVAMPLVWLGFEEALMADPNMPVGPEFVFSRSVAPAVRRKMALASVSGMCYNGREMLFGASMMRHQLVARVRTYIRDIPGLDQKLAEEREFLDGFLSSPRGITGIFRRLDWCRRNEIPN